MCLCLYSFSAQLQFPDEIHSYSICVKTQLFSEHPLNGENGESVSIPSFKKYINKYLNYFQCLYIFKTGWVLLTHWVHCVLFIGAFPQLLFCWTLAMLNFLWLNTFKCPGKSTSYCYFMDYISVCMFNLWRCGARKISNSCCRQLMEILINKHTVVTKNKQTNKNTCRMTGQNCNLNSTVCKLAWMLDCSLFAVILCLWSFFFFLLFYVYFCLHVSFFTLCGHCESLFGCFFNC